MPKTAKILFTDRLLISTATCAQDIFLEWEKFKNAAYKREVREKEIAQGKIDGLLLNENGCDDLKSAWNTLVELEKKCAGKPFIDKVDIRYNRFERIPKPVTKAVMFCPMDVSGSMDQGMKDLAKRFYKLLYLFLTTQYQDTQIVFIRHTHIAKEVDEETFFNGAETGATIVSTALEEIQKIKQARFPSNEWNIYVAQVSDGDNAPGDGAKCLTLLRKILPDLQHFAYLEVSNGQGYHRAPTELWKTYELLKKEMPKLFESSNEFFAMRKAAEAKQIYPVFESLFSKHMGGATRPATPIAAWSVPSRTFAPPFP